MGVGERRCPKASPLRMDEWLKKRRARAWERLPRRWRVLSTAEILEGRHGLERPYHQGFDHHEIILHVLHTGGILGQDAKGLAFALVEDHPR